MQDHTWQPKGSDTQPSSLSESAIQNKSQDINKQGNDDLLSFLQNSPLQHIDLDTTRNKELPR